MHYLKDINSGGLNGCHGITGNFSCGPCAYRFNHSLKDSDMSKFNAGDAVYLESDKDQEPFRVTHYTRKISKGPMQQLPPSPVVAVRDSKDRYWEFREDSLIALKNAP